MQVPNRNTSRRLQLLLLVLVGFAVGSFLDLAVGRLRRGESVLWPPSHCYSCDQALRAFDLVPVFSYLQTRGRCRYCGAAVPGHVFLSELTGGVAVFAAYMLFEKLGFGMEFYFIIVAASTLGLVSVLSASRTSTPLVLGLPALVLAAAMAPFWSTSGALRPFPHMTGMVASELDSLIAALLVASIYIGYTLVMSRKLELRKLILVTVAGMFSGLIGLVLILVLAITVDFGIRGLRHSSRMGATAASVRREHVHTVLAVGAVVTLLAEPWVDHLAVVCSQVSHYAPC